jgi:hypothetical protein
MKKSKPKVVPPQHILVTGDIVVDHHLYGGLKTTATDLGKQGTENADHAGGAALTEKLVSAAADAKGLAWDKVQIAWAKENKKRKATNKKRLARPEDHPVKRPPRIFGTSLALDSKNLRKDLYTHLHSYGVWTPQPVKKGSKELVWRISKDHHFGYGATDQRTPGCCFKPSKKPLPASPSLTLIDDGGILFRHETCRAVWPDISKVVADQYLLKMSRPLCRGDLWSYLAPILDRLTVVVSAQDLRLEDAQINARLSWERCVEDTINAFKVNPTARRLLKAANIIVNYGSAGALWIENNRETKATAYHLVFNPAQLEGDDALQFEGAVYGYQTCFVAGIGYHLMLHQLAIREPMLQPGGKAGPLEEHRTFSKAVRFGIAAGLNARNKLQELGHGEVGKSSPGFPVNDIGRSIAGTPVGYVSVDIPEDSLQNPDCPWTILAQLESTDNGAATEPLVGLAELTALHGASGSLSDVPVYRKDKLLTVDRSEIESLRTLETLITAYNAVKVQKKPLSIGVFGPPGAGKSFAVKVLAEAILGKEAPFIEFNLSQFKGPEELIGAFHRIRDAALKEVTPVAFWDEFDSQNYKWLQYLLAPMQDGSFQEGQITHPIGKCIFIFAGGTSPVMECFGVAKPQMPSSVELEALLPELRGHRLQEYREQSQHFREFSLLKGPDFISRLHGFLNVLGPNPRAGGTDGGHLCTDFTWPVRRALLLRGILKLGDNTELDMDPGLLHALLGVSVYRHGSRSFEKVLESLLQGRAGGRMNRSALPPQSLLNRETDARDLYELLSHGDAFRNYANLEDLAAAIHFKFLDNAEKSKIEAAIKANPSHEWTIDPSIKKTYGQLSADAKASNLAAAQRIPGHLALIGYVVIRQEEGDDGSWQAPLAATIKRHVDRLAKAEHLGWCAERIANGWTYGKRDNDRKHHPLLVPWTQLSSADQDKDRSSVRDIPNLLNTAKFKACPLPRTKKPA